MHMMTSDKESQYRGEKLDGGDIGIDAGQLW